MAAKNKPQQGQLEFPFITNRRIQFQVMTKVYFPDNWKTREGQLLKGVSGLVLKMILMVIDSRARSDSWCTASYWKIGSEANLKVGEKSKPRTAHVRRAIRILEERGFLIIPHAKKRGEVKIRPNWHALIEFANLSDDERETLLEELQLPRVERRGQQLARERAPEAVECKSFDAPENGVDAPENKVDAPENKVDAPENEVDAPEIEIDAPLEGQQTRTRLTISRTYIKQIKRGTRAIGFMNLNSRDLDYVDRLMGEIFNVVHTDPANQRDWELVAKVAVMAAVGHIGESDIAAALRSMREGDQSHIRYFVGCMKRVHEQIGENLGDCLVRVHLPEELERQRRDFLPEP